jgi:membrane protease YdiL (CAAX protease family)
LDSRLPAATSAAPAQAWGFWATLGWFAAAAATFVLSNIVIGIGYAVWHGINHPTVPLDMESPVLGFLVTAISMPIAALVLMLAARRGGSVRGYLGLVWPHWRHILVGFSMLIVVGLVGEGMIRLFPSFDQTPEMIAEYRAIMGNPAALALYWFTLVVTAPIAEEIIFRGFLMRGWSTSRVGIAGAIALSSLIFAVIHTQYNVLGVTMVLMLGLVFAVMRWRSGSIVLTIMMHAVWNLACGVLFMLSA